MTETISFHRYARGPGQNPMTIYRHATAGRLCAVLPLKVRTVRTFLSQLVAQ
jgi:hypothetical protein